MPDSMGLLGLLMSGSDMGQGSGNDYLSLMLFQKLLGGDSDISDNNRLKMMLFAPFGKKLVTRLAQRIQQKSTAEGIPMANSTAELHAADIIKGLEEEQEGDIRTILKMARMSVQMNLLNSSGIEHTPTPRPETLGTGGYVKGILAEEKTPAAEIQEIVLGSKKEKGKNKKNKKMWE